MTGVQTVLFRSRAGAPTAVRTTISGSLNRGGGLSRGRCSSIDGDSVRIKLYGY